MKSFSYALLLSCLTACRVSQPPSLIIADSGVIAALPVAAAIPPAIPVSSASIAIVGDKIAALAEQTPRAKYQPAAQQRKQPGIVRFVSHNHTASLQKAWQRQRIAHPASSTAAGASAISPAHSFILLGIGALLVTIGLLALPSTTLSGIFLVGLALLAGVIFMLFGLFSYLIGLLKRGRKA